MHKGVVIAVVEDDEGHANLIRRNLKRTGLANEIIFFKDGEGALNFFLKRGGGPHRDDNSSYIILLDILMPKVNGDEVLKALKEDEVMRRTPIVMVTTTDDVEQIEHCHDLGCNNYIVKPIDAEEFIEVIRQLGLYLMVIEVPEVDDDLAS